MACSVVNVYFSVARVADRFSPYASAAASRISSASAGLMASRISSSASITLMLASLAAVAAVKASSIA